MSLREKGKFKEWEGREINLLVEGCFEVNIERVELGLVHIFDVIIIFMGKGRYQGRNIYH